MTYVPFAVTAVSPPKQQPPSEFGLWTIPAVCKKWMAIGWSKLDGDTKYSRCHAVVGKKSPNVFVIIFNWHTCCRHRHPFGYVHVQMFLQTCFVLRPSLTSNVPAHVYFGNTIPNKPQYQSYSMILVDMWDHNNLPSKNRLLKMPCKSCAKLVPEVAHLLRITF